MLPGRLPGSIAFQSRYAPLFSLKVCGIFLFEIFFGHLCTGLMGILSRGICNSLDVSINTSKASLETPSRLVQFTLICAMLETLKEVFIGVHQLAFRRSLSMKSIFQCPIQSGISLILFFAVCVFPFATAQPATPAMISTIGESALASSPGSAGGGRLGACTKR
jgi:hypothetical protein